MEKLKDRLLAEEENYESKLLSQQIYEKHYLIIKPKIYNFMYIDAMKIKIGFITNIFL